MDGDEEHALREYLLALWIGQVPHLRARLLVQLCLQHDLLHLAVGERSTIVRVKHLHHVHVVFLLFRANVPRTLLLLKAQLSY